MDQLSFKIWLEAVQLIRQYQDSHRLTPLGKLGWWTVYSAKIEGERWDGDHVAQLRNTHVKPVFEEAAQRLAKIGFPRMHANVVIVGLEDMKNPITGGGVAGYAHDKKHGFTVDRGNINANVVIHEHAHMIWFNLPKENQQYFKRYYRESISDRIIDPKDMWQHAELSFDPTGLDKAIEESWTGFKEDMSRVIGHNFEAFFNVRKTLEENDESKLIESTVLTRFGNSSRAVTKKPVPMLSHSYGPKTIEAGQIVKVEKFDRFILNHWEDGKHWEYKQPLERQELHDWVTFKPELLNEEQMAKMESTIKLAKDKKPSRFFAPNSKKEEIEKAFEEVAKDVANKFKFAGGRAYNSTTFNPEQLFPIPRFYQTWMSRIGRRFKAGKIVDMEGIKQTFIDSVKSQAKGSLKNVPANISTSDLRGKGYDYANIGSEKGSKLRDLIHQKGITPNAYGAANIDELWAVAVEYAAMDWNVSQKLKKLIYSTISGTQM